MVMRNAGDGVVLVSGENKDTELALRIKGVVTPLRFALLCFARFLLGIFLALDFFFFCPRFSSLLECPFPS